MEQPHLHAIVDSHNLKMGLHNNLDFFALADQRSNDKLDKLSVLAKFIKLVSIKYFFPIGYG